MKRILKTAGAFIAVALMVGFTLLRFGYFAYRMAPTLFLDECDRRGLLSRASGVDLSGGETVCDTEDSSFFDGGYRLRKKTNTGEMGAEIKESPLWKPAPIPEEIDTLLHDRCGDAFDSRSIENGRWFFYNRQSEETGYYGDIGQDARHSYSFLLAVYDIDRDVLYVCDCHS